MGPYGAVSSTCYGCRPYHFYYGKRSAEPHGAGVAVHPGLATSFNGPTVYGYPSVYGKREAEPHGAGVAVHPGVATSFRGPTVFGYPSVHYIGKRSAQPQFPNVIPSSSDLTTSTSTGGFSGYGKREAEPHGTGVAFHPFGVSHVGPTVFGYPYYGKRSAEPHGLGVHPGHATSYVGRTVFGYPRIYGKRSADAEPEADAFYGYYPYHAYGGYSYGVPGGYTSVSGLWG